MTPRRYFVKTCARDLEWLSYLLRSLAKFDPGAQVRVIADGFDDLESPYLAENPAWPGLCGYADVVTSMWPEAARIPHPYIRQQYVKMLADRVFPVGVHIQIDSDCFMLRHPVVGDFEDEDGRPLWFYDPWDKLPAGVPWRVPTEAALKMVCPWEAMRRPALPVAADLLASVRARIEDVQGRPLIDYLASVGRFSEYNVIGSWLIAQPTNYRLREAITIPGGTWGIPDSPCVEQGWSRKPMDDARRQRYEAILSG